MKLNEKNLQIESPLIGEKVLKNKALEQIKLNLKFKTKLSTDVRTKLSEEVKYIYEYSEKKKDEKK